MPSQINSLLTAIKQIEGLEKLNTLSDFRDAIEYGIWPKARAKLVLKLLLDRFFSPEPYNEELQDKLHRSLNLLLLKRSIHFDAEDLAPLLEQLKHDPDADRICEVLDFLALVHKRDFLPIIEPYTSHLHPGVAACAEEAIRDIKARA